jgi:hypothetical protein
MIKMEAGKRYLAHGWFYRCKAGMSQSDNDGPIIIEITININYILIPVE